MFVRVLFHEMCTVTLPVFMLCIPLMACCLFNTLSLKFWLLARGLTSISTLDCLLLVASHCILTCT